MGKYLLGIDNGNTVSKAILYRIDRVIMGAASRKSMTFYPKPGHSERNMANLWSNNVENIKEILEQTNINPHDISAICNTVSWKRALFAR